MLLSESLLDALNRYYEMYCNFIPDEFTSSLS